MKPYSLFVFLALCALSAPVFAVEKCLKDGKVIYTDQPCQSMGANTQKSFVPAAPSNSDGRAPATSARPASVENNNVSSLSDARSAPQSTPTVPNNQAACERVSRQLDENARAARLPQSASSQDYLAEGRRRLHDEGRSLGCGGS